MRSPRWILQVACAALTLGAAPALAQQPATPAAPARAPAKPGKKEAAPPLPPIEARLWVIAPSPQEPWTMRIDNEGALPIRIPADVRLLRFELEKPDEKNPKRRHKMKCRAPDALREDGFPDKRALLLAPGESYVESFSPYLFCFGKEGAAIAGATVVKSTFGWDPPPKHSKKPPEGPFAAEGTDHPPSRQAARQLQAPTLVLPYAPSKPLPLEPPEGEPAPPEKPPVAAPPEAANGAPRPEADPKPEDKPDGAARPAIVDENAPRLELTAGAFADAPTPRRATVTVTAKNVGHRPMRAALRARMLSFRIEGPDKTTHCAHAPATHAIPKEGFGTVKPGASTSFTVLLAEVCPREAFERAGLYRVTATLHAEESGKEHGLAAYTGVVHALAPTLVRVHASAEPYYDDKAPPEAVPTAKIGATDE